MNPAVPRALTTQQRTQTPSQTSSCRVAENSQLAASFCRRLYNLGVQVADNTEPLPNRTGQLAALLLTTTITLMKPTTMPATAMMMVMVVVVVLGRVTPAESAPPSVSTTPFLTTLPAGCRADNGQVVYPGPEVTLKEHGACRICSCSWQGQLTCYYVDCYPAVCVSPVDPPGACCPHCPNDERNCRISGTGEVIKADIQVERDGKICQCPPFPHDFGLPFVLDDVFITAICTDMTTIPPTFTPSDGIPVGRR